MSIDCPRPVRRPLPLTSWSTTSDVSRPPRTTSSTPLTTSSGSPSRTRGRPLDGIDSSFVFDFASYDDPDDDRQRWSTWLDVEPLCRGPEPRPDWVVTSQGAIDTELGILKTGKEADVFLLERADPHDPDGGVVMAAKRYRSTEHRTFHRAASYTEGRSMKRSRDERALKRKSTWGKRRRRRRVGGLGVGRAQAAAGRSGCRSPTRCRSTAPRS